MENNQNNNFANNYQPTNQNFNNNQPNDFNNNQAITQNNNNNQANHQIIEIPQEYYDKLAKEQQKEELAKEAQQAVNTIAEENKVSSFFIPLVIINAIVIYALFYITINKNIIAIAGILLYVVLGSFIFSIKDKKKTDFPLSIIIGGMITAVICFIISMLNEENMDLWTYYTTASAITGFVGMFISNIITKIITDIKNIKALQIIGYLLFFAALIAGPYYVYQKWPTEFNQIVFFKKNEIIAETYEDYVLKTLKARYNTEFNCDFANKELHKTEKNELMTTFTCTTSLTQKPISVRTIPYNETENKHTIIDNFIEQLYLKDIKEDIAKKIQNTTGASLVKIYLYPKDTCMFVGDCTDCVDYYANYTKINNAQNRYEVSSSLNLSKYIGLETTDFINEYINNNQYKIIIQLKGNYNKQITDFDEVKNLVLKGLKKTKLKNTYGYEIVLYNLNQNIYTKEHTIVEKTNETKEFK